MYDSTLKLFELTGLPMPPSHNHIYINIPNIGRVPSKVFNNFKKEFKIWAANNESVLRPCRLKCISTMDEGLKFDVSLKLWFKREKIYTKDNRVKKLDVSNRIKVIHDAVAEALCVDDSNFWSVHAIKIAVDTVQMEQNWQENCSLAFYKHVMDF